MLKQEAPTQSISGGAFLLILKVARSHSLKKLNHYSKIKESL